MTSCRPETIKNVISGLDLVFEKLFSCKNIHKLSIYKIFVKRHGDVMPTGNDQTRVQWTRLSIGINIQQIWLKFWNNGGILNWIESVIRNLPSWARWTRKRVIPIVTNEFISYLDNSLFSDDSILLLIYKWEVYVN